MEVIAQYKNKEIPKVIDPTVAAFAPLLKAKKNFIREIPVKSFTYGPTDRHQLDIYYPLTTTSEKAPILFFIYGGGFNTGERSISPRSFGLVYACLAAFFARRGYIVVVPDYRLVPHVLFPGPAEDIRDAIRWVINNPENLVSDGSPFPDLNTIVMMGHSAGAAHIATLLFHPNVLLDNDELRSKIKAAVLESPPYDLSAMTMDWGETAAIHTKYWGTLEGAKANDPLHLYRRLPNTVIEALPKILMVEAEREPDWLANAGTAFHEEIRTRTGENIKRIIAKGHNHVSLNWALSSGEGEDWGEQVAEWLSEITG
ncbi:hypothetical protein GALMADRAFT_125849 [Galerina marginata CBS 339.88]|uniref:BD-FAE-like domain-containing protein n=1 Tax=Galerina marginata (strain CBS 339.88) TaxID=685588 RepID=A0A067SPX7_GALM3|nr:hypothetical protein GALMADRAFT_125849 [Galerina marginata CBS 339.88]